MPRSFRPTHRVDGVADGPTLVLVNSLATTTAMWDRFVPLVADRFRVVRYDLPGHGRSSEPPPTSADDLGTGLIEVLDAFGAERAYVCGVSIGGVAAMCAAAEAPERVDRLVVCSAAATFATPAFWNERATAVADGGMSSIDTLLHERWFAASTRASEDHDPTSVIDMIRATNPDAYVAFCRVLASCDLTPRLARIAAPALVVVGAEDPSVKLEQAEALCAGMPSAQIHVIQGASHLVPLERPEAFAAAALAHLEEVGA